MVLDSGMNYRCFFCAEIRNDNSEFPPKHYFQQFHMDFAQSHIIFFIIPCLF